MIRCVECNSEVIDRYAHTLRMKDRVFICKICQLCNKFVLVYASTEDLNRSNFTPLVKDK